MQTFPVHNPATGEHLGDVPNHGAAETDRAIAAAHEAMHEPTTLDQRRAWLTGMADRMLAQKDELARVITLEMGKPLKESVVEVEYAAGFFRVYASHLDRLAPEPLPEPIRNARWTIHHRPAGVAGLITPWNFPLAMMAKKLPAAIGAGCGVVWKPADLTPLTALAWLEAIEPVGLPKGLINIVTGRPAAPIGDALCRHPAVRVISFTGSTAVGKQLIANTAPHVKRLSLELGGNAPFIVFDDADAEKTATHLIANKFRAAGQTCVCANRLLVQRGLVERFVAAVKPRVEALKVGNGLDPATDIGPLIGRGAFEKVARHVQDAVAKGARRIVGRDASPPPEGQQWGAFFPPTLLTDVPPNAELCSEETFGPVVAIMAFDTEDEAVRLANGTDYGLAAYVFTADTQRLDRLAGQLRFGHVGLNTGAGPTPEAPFGGMKQSGFGREGGAEGLMEFTETQVTAHSS